MAASRQFPTSYQASREDFLGGFQKIQERWPGARLQSQLIHPEEGLQIDWIAADPSGAPQKVLIITSGVHGVEGFVGSRMRALFMDEFLDELDPENTGLYLVHAINPWGMKHKRRVTRNNVDLNRNFVLEEEDFQGEINPEYQLYDHVLNPDRPLRPLWQEVPGVIGQVTVNLLRAGVKSLRSAVLQGQRVNPAGLYFTGDGYEPETRVVMALIKEVFSKYQDALLIDMHTGYGPKYQMCIVNSPEEEREAEQLVGEFQYPLIRKADPEQFYAMQGDMVDWFYKYRRSAGLEGKFYGAGFEFGTIGGSIPHEFISLWNMIFENQAYWKGSLKGETKTRVEKILLEMYFPTEEKWREKALADCRLALRGVLSQEGYLAQE